MNDLYPLKFKPIIKNYIWGGNKLKDSLKKDTGKYATAAESWEISGVSGDISVVSNGKLKGNTLQELIEIYMGELVGDRIYDKFGIEFPVLIKFIDAHLPLSVQVHPNDELSKQRHSAYGKTEMWYVLEAEKDAYLISGFNGDVNKDLYLEKLKQKSLKDILHYETVKEGDVFFIPAGRVHAIGKGILLTEIQQTSDITYRIYDWDRLDDKGNSRELHTELALDAIDFSAVDNAKTDYSPAANESALIVDCPHFTTNIINFDKSIDKNYAELDSFVIYICTKGSFKLNYNSGSETLSRGDTILLPASLDNLNLQAEGNTSILEIFIGE